MTSVIEYNMRDSGFGNFKEALSISTDSPGIESELF
jgi:hypothetical protein